MKLLSILRWTVLLGIVAAVICLCITFKNSPKASNFKHHASLVTELRPAMELCTVEIIEDVPIKGHIGTKHIFARTTLNGYISFNLDSIATTMSGDTLVVVLPSETVEIRESTQPDTYEVIDTWNEKLLGSSKFTAAEENAIKRKVVENFRKAVYAKGYVRQARADAVATLGQMLPAMSPTPVKIVDPAPGGYLLP